ncbi:MAG: isoprenylcysteine carboxylmethyltransferase family protein [Deferribacteraceae bacterium]|jgi:protein-S-isoprenylcysteine O-methyltransferase Ste14|nr:isoprenylcysteine carboxylmethyltransferase family protein [Deferribacteraceae bacterium]
MTTTSVTKKTFFAVLAFYLLIAFEMLYMAGPFAMYFYGVYSPVLNFFNQNAALSALNSFFMPHIARETSSVIINLHEYVGGTLAIFGFVAFLWGACQIYYSKFARKGAVTGGIYNYIRHPQYSSFAICGLGMLIVWPRVINLLMFVSMLFVYYILAKAEERECEAKFGESYLSYKAQTRMFIPFNLPFRLPELPKARGKRALDLLIMYICAIAAAFALSYGVTMHSINSLYAVYTEDSATMSLAEIETSKLEQIMAIANAEFDQSVAHRLNAGGVKMLNYVLPAEWYAAEVAMNDGAVEGGHVQPADYDHSKYKVIFTAVDCWNDASGKDILLSVKLRQPLAELWVDLDKQAVTKVLDIPEGYMYQGIPVAVY